MAIREDIVHYAIRRYLRSREWTLIAGQYPNGTDDELSALNVTDPALARDVSPDHRRHSRNKLVPDLVAYRDDVVVVVEMKPVYDANDEAKLERLLTVRRDDFMTRLRALIEIRFNSLSVSFSTVTVVPALGFGKDASYPRRDDWAYFLVGDENSVVTDDATPEQLVAERLSE